MVARPHEGRTQKTPGRPQKNLQAPESGTWSSLNRIQPSRLFFPCHCAQYRFRQRCGRAFDVHVDHSERQRWQTTKLSTLTFPQILWNHVFIKPFIGRSTMTNPPRKRCKSRPGYFHQVPGSVLWRALLFCLDRLRRSSHDRKRIQIASSLRPEMKANSRE